MTTNPSPDAVEALSDYYMELVEADYAQDLKDGIGLPLDDDMRKYHKMIADKTAAKIVSGLNEKGFTIVRQPAMTDAELEREAMDIEGAWCGEDDWGGVLAEMVVALAKKYRG